MDQRQYKGVIVSLCWEQYEHGNPETWVKELFLTTTQMLILRASCSLGIDATLLLHSNTID